MNKTTIFTILGTIGAFISEALGGWDTAMVTLVTFMGIDYVTGMITAGIFHKSKKTENGGLNSSVGWKGLMKKALILLVVIMSVKLGVLTEAHFIRDGVCIAFIINETTSILENLGLCGIPLPAVLKKAIAILQERGDKNDT